MGEAFWGGMFVALPAIIASVMAYWKSEKAEARASIAEQLSGVCRYTPGKPDGLIQQQVEDSSQDINDLAKRLSVLEYREETNPRNPCNNG